MPNKVLSFDLIKTQKDNFNVRCNTTSSKGNDYGIYQFTVDKSGVQSKLVDKKLIKAEWATHTCPYTH